MGEENKNNPQTAPQQPLAIDTLKISQLLHIRQEVYERILLNSFAPTEKDLEDLDQTIAAGDFDQIGRLAHRLKGVYYNLRIDPLGKMAEEMNGLAKAKMNKERIKELLGEFKSYFSHLKERFVSL